MTPRYRFPSPPSLAQLAEEARRDRWGNRIGDARRIARLEQLRRRAANRWRRRAGRIIAVAAPAGAAGGVPAD